MITRQDIDAFDHMKFLKHRDGLIIYKPSEGSILVPFDRLPDLLLVAAQRLQENR